MSSKKKKKKAGAKKAAPAKKKKAAAKKAAAPAKKAPATEKKKKKKALAKKAAPAKNAGKKASAKKNGSKKKGGGSNFGETLLRALTLAMLSDGEIQESEAEILVRFAKEPLFKGVDAPAVIESTIEQCIADGPEVTLGEIKDRLTTDEERETAFTSCVAIAVTDGKVTASEVRMLKSLQVAFDIPKARAKSLAGPIGAIFK